MPVVFCPVPEAAGVTAHLGEDALVGPGPQPRAEPGLKLPRICAGAVAVLSGKVQVMMPVVWSRSQRSAEPSPQDMWARPNCSIMSSPCSSRCSSRLAPRPDQHSPPHWPA
jgi:hypothetical protein